MGRGQCDASHVHAKPAPSTSIQARGKGCQLMLPVTTGGQGSSPRCAPRPRPDSSVAAGACHRAGAHPPPVILGHDGTPVLLRSLGNNRWEQVPLGSSPPWLRGPSQGAARPTSVVGRLRAGSSSTLAGTHLASGHGLYLPAAPHRKMMGRRTSPESSSLSASANKLLPPLSSLSSGALCSVRQTNLHLFSCCLR